MMSKKTHLEREQLTMARMVGIYCTDRHGSDKTSLCEACQKFLDYADVRLTKCPYAEDKPTCANCPVHCYKPAHRAMAKMIMRYSGPRMLLRHPLLAIAHQLRGFRKVKHPIELTRRQRAETRNRRIDSN